MKSNWRNLESKRSNIMWGIICFLVFIGMTVATIFYIINDDSSIIAIFIIVGIIFLIGSIMFFRDAIHQKEIAEEQKQVENSNYEKVKQYGEMISSMNLSEDTEKDSKKSKIVSFEENVKYLLKNDINYSVDLDLLISEIKDILVARNDMMQMSDTQICKAIETRLIEFGIKETVANSKSLLVLKIYRKCKENPYFDVTNEEY